MESLSPDRHVKAECVRERMAECQCLKEQMMPLRPQKPRAELTGYGKAKLLVAAVVKTGFGFGVTQ